MGQVIHDSGKRLERLIENFLIYAQIELLGADAQKVGALRQKQTQSPAKLIEEHAVGQARAAKRADDLVLDLADHPMPMSEDYLAKIVDELVQNAFKFSESGKRVSVSALRLRPMASCSRSRTRAAVSRPSISPRSALTCSSTARSRNNRGWVWGW